MSTIVILNFFSFSSFNLCFNSKWNYFCKW